MAQKRTNTERKIENEKFKLKLGTTNRECPLVVYLEGGTFITPNEEKENYLSDIKLIKRKFNRAISENLKLNDSFDKDFILDFTIAESRITFNKKSFLSFQFLLRQNKNKIRKIKELKETSSGFFNNIINSLENSISEQNFSINKTKKL